MAALAKKRLGHRQRSLRRITLEGWSVASRALISTCKRLAWLTLSAIVTVSRPRLARKGFGAGHVVGFTWVIWIWIDPASGDRRAHGFWSGALRGFAPYNDLQYLLIPEAC